MNSPTPSCAGIVGEGFGNSKQPQPKVVAEKREAEDEPDCLRDLLAQAGIDAQASSVAARLQEIVIERVLGPGVSSRRSLVNCRARLD